jgi:hypothetical protein
VTIEKGRPWGTPGPLPDDGVLVRSDAEARRVVTDALRANRAVPPLGLLGGDLCRTLGGLGDEDRIRSAAAMTFPVDLGRVLVDGRLHWFVAHLIARRSWWRGRAVVVMNAQWLGDWDLAPRSHPNDGLLDATDGCLPLRDRWAARRRVRTGSHLPHPALRTTRAAALSFDLDPPLGVELDGEPIGRARHLVIQVLPDALTVVV